jgi:drug/metabolite transporter (DMT)-like permease
MQHIPPLIFSSLDLLDPALVAILSWVGGVEHLPSAYSWIGGMVVMGGVGLISYAEHKRSQK